MFVYTPKITQGWKADDCHLAARSVIFGSSIDLLHGEVNAKNQRR